jgi:CBS domain containing-hemolysin-like protein
LVRARRSGARSAQHAVEHIDAYLSACQLGITLASLGLGAVGEPAFHELLEPVFGDGAEILGFGLASAIAFSIITVLHVVLGELAPRAAPSHGRSRSPSPSRRSCAASTWPRSRSSTSSTSWATWC